jgi:hypothetical protein
MSLLDNLSKMLLGYKGVKPKFNSETYESTLHNQSSTLGQPTIKRNPSNLDEADKLNNAKYNSAKGRKYLDQQFK